MQSTGLQIEPSLEKNIVYKQSFLIIFIFEFLTQYWRNI